MSNSTITITDLAPRELRRPSARRSAATASTPRRGVRLTRRGRAVILLVALCAVLAVGFFFGAGSVASQRAGTPEATTIVQVESGQTLWSIASELTPEGDDVRETMFHIKRLNALDSSALAAGQRLRVPFAGE